MSIKIGISGWNYEGWRGTFYPPKLAHYKELEFASQQLPTIEINGTFYSLQSPSSYKRWYSTTPKNFIFSVKANRYITHIKRLNDIEIPMVNFFASGLLELKEKLGPILWQFPPNMLFEPEKFKHFLELLPLDFREAGMIGKGTNFPLRHAVEVRHHSFLNPWFTEMLRKHNVAIVFADTAGKWPYLEDLTADFVYIRMHGDSELYVSGYDDPTLDFWAKRILTWADGKEPEDRLTITDETNVHRWRDVFVYFDNDAKVRAPVDAKSLIKKTHSALNYFFPQPKSA